MYYVIGVAYEDVAIEDRDAAFKAHSASSVGSSESQAIAQPSDGQRDRNACNAAAHDSAPTRRSSGPSAA